MSTEGETYEGIAEPGPMEDWINRNALTASVISSKTQVVPVTRAIKFAREQDATLAALTAALESHMVTESGEGRETVSHTANCGCWRTGDPEDCGHSCKLTRAALARAGRLPQ